MKKLLLALLSFSSIAVFAQNGTCIPSIGVDCVAIPNFIDSASTTFGVTNFTNNGTDCNTQDQNYQDYQNKIASEVLGGNLLLHVRLNQSLPAFIGVWADWNNDLIFGSGELVNLTASPLTVTNFIVNVPMNAVIDTLILRIRCADVSMGPCDSVTSGETEDYRLIVLATTGVNGAEYFTWNISPNPAEDLLVVEMENESAEISIYDVLGNEVLKMASVNGTTRVDVSGLSQGTYFVRVSAEGKSSVKKFVH